MADVPKCQNMAAWWSMGFITSWRCEISLGKSEKIHNCPQKKTVILHPKHPLKEWSSSRHIPWNQGFHREDSDSPNNLVSSQQLGELLRWRPFLFVRRLTGLCDFFWLLRGSVLGRNSRRVFFWGSWDRQFDIPKNSNQTWGDFMVQAGIFEG